MKRWSWALLLAAPAWLPGPAAAAADLTAVPALTIQNLPRMQRTFRINALRAVSKDIQHGATMALQTYEPADTLPPGWQYIVVPRQRAWFRASASVVLLRVDDRRRSVEIAVRGTQTLDDALYDLKADAVLDEELGVRLHAGFRSLAREVLDHLKQHALTEAMLTDYRFSLYGHSLGGAVAAILSMYLHEAGSQVVSVVTFGAPRFTTNEGARKYQVLNQVTHRIVRCDDVVPFLPPPNFFGWSNESYQANGNVFLMLQPPYFDYSVGIDIERDFVWQLRLDLENRQATDVLAYGHRMTSYYQRLWGFTPAGLVDGPRPQPDVDGDTVGAGVHPVTYTLALQSRLCPAQPRATH